MKKGKIICREKLELNMRETTGPSEEETAAGPWTRRSWTLKEECLNVLRTDAHSSNSSSASVLTTQRALHKEEYGNMYAKMILGN